MANYLDAAGLNIYHNGATINEKKLPATLYAQDIPSKNLLPETDMIVSVANGIIYKVNADGSVTANGTANGQSMFLISSIREGKASKFSGMIISGCPSGGGLEKYYIGVQLGANPWTWYGRDIGDGIVLSTMPTSGTVNVLIIICDGNTVSNLTFRPMIRPANITDDTYVPYAKTNIELTKDPLPRTVATWSGGVSKDLGGSTFLDSGAVAVNNSGGTLQFKTISTSNITAKGDWTIPEGYGDKFGRMVYIKIQVQGGTWANGWNDLVQLPSEFRPYRANTLLCGLDNNSDDYFQVRIDTNGTIKGYKKTGLSNNVWIFGSYSTD